MFGRSEQPRRKKSGVTGIFQLFLSLIMFAILGIGLYLAYRNFSGYDPLKLSPESLVKSILSSDSVYKLVTEALSFSPDKSLTAKISNLTGSPVSSIVPADSSTPTGELKFKFAVMADSHIDYQDLQQALKLAKDDDAKFIIGMGDFSNVGTIDELTNTKKQFDAINIPYYVTPGDHDLWDSRNQKKAADTNFLTVFKTPAYQSFSYSGVRILMLYDSDDYLGLDAIQQQWVNDQVSRVSSEKPDLFFVFADTPLYHPSSDHVMGRVVPQLKTQADNLLSLFQKSGVNEIFSADTHFFSRYSDPTTNLKITTVGAITDNPNAQTPRFAIVDVYTNGSYNIEETQVK